MTSSGRISWLRMVLPEGAIVGEESDPASARVSWLQMVLPEAPVQPAARPDLIVTLENVLGCGEYEAKIVGRGGIGVVAALEGWTTLQWERKLSDTSQAQVSVAYERKCAGLIANARPWQHELAIYRNGDPVWIGPLLQPKWAAEAADFVARDLSAWFDKRRIHEDHDHSTDPGIDQGLLFAELVEDGISTDNSMGVSITAHASGTVATQKHLGAQHLILGEVLRQLAQVGADWTFSVRELVIGGTAVPVATLGPFTDDHFIAPPQVAMDGTQQTNSPGVRGAGGGDQGDTVYGQADDPGVQIRDGLLETVETQSTLLDNTSAAAAASSSLEARRTVPTVSQAILSPDAPIQIDQLVPGALVQLMLDETGIPIHDIYRLSAVNVSAGSQGFETVQLTFQPRGDL